jgi:hypothetical protein
MVAKSKFGRDPNKMSASKKQAAHGKFRDLKAKKNPKGGAPVVYNGGSQLQLGSLNGVSASSGGGTGKSPSPGDITIAKTSDSSSPSLFVHCT